MVTRTDIPLCSAVGRMQGDADYWDAYQVELARNPPSALHAYLEFAARTPKWIDGLMRLRNAVVRLLSLKDVGQLQAGEGGTRRSSSIGAQARPAALPSRCSWGGQ